jgi:hypothetical protein
VPLVYFFIQHAVHRKPGGASFPNNSQSSLTYACTIAYTHYAFFEWGLIFLDILYDSACEVEFRDAGLEVEFLFLLHD